MNGIIKIQKYEVNNELVETVNSRELHDKLEVKTNHRDWIRRRIEEAQLVEEQDFIVSLKNERNLQGGRPSKEYFLTLDSAKHFAMLERSKIGREIRQYFIDFEKKAKEAFQEITNIDEDPLIVMARKHVAIQKEQQRQRDEQLQQAVKMVKQSILLNMETKRNDSQDVIISKQKTEIEELKAKLERERKLRDEAIHEINAKADAVLEGHEYYTIAGYAKKMHIPMPRKVAQRLGYAATKLSNQLDYPIQKRPHPDYGEINSYHEVVLQEVFRNYIEGT